MAELPLIKQVSSRDNPLLVQLRKQLKDPAGYRKSTQVWLEGEHLCEAAIQQGIVASQAVITESAWQHSGLRDLALRALGVVVVPQALMAGLSSLDSPCAIGFVVPLPEASELRIDQPSVVLDRLQDPGNVGTILRSAAALGFTQVIGLKGTVAMWSPKVLRSAMGAHFALHLVESLDAQDLTRLRVPLLLSSPHAHESLNAVTLPWPCAWAMGHEGQGVSEEVAQHCAQQLRIPQPGGQESLNVASAAAICLYESARSRC